MQKNHLQALYDFGKFGIKFGLKTMNALLRLLGNPHHSLRIIHCAGTNGKGSTLVTLEKLLRASNYSVGLTTSPHLVDYNERFRLNGAIISDSDLSRIFLRICSVCGIDPDSPTDTSCQRLAPTFFEISIAIALVWFQEQRVDYALLETGMGGRLDATNVITPIAHILTPISMDHEEFLGTTLLHIAQQKLGIIKPHIPTFVALQKQSTLRLIRKKCSELSSDLYEWGEDIRVEENDEGISYSLSYGKGQGRSEKKQLQIKKLGLHGKFQQMNTGVALSVYYNLITPYRHLNKNEINQVLAEVSWPGRLHYVKDSNPQLLCDGAHNESGTLELLKYLRQYHSKEKILFAITWMKNKHFSQLLLKELDLDFTFLPISFEKEQAMKTEDINRDLSSGKHVILPSKNLEIFALECREKKYANQYDLVLLSGSLYFIGDFFRYFDQNDRSSIYWRQAL